MKITTWGAFALLLCLLSSARAAAPDWAAAAADALPDLTQGRPAPPELLGTALAGRWQGALEYRDYGNGRRVVLPTSASIAASGDGALLVDFVYDDGPGKTVRSSERWVLAGDRFSMEKAGAPLAVSAYRTGEGDRDVTLAALGAGNDNQAPVQVRMVLQRRGDELIISRATQLPGQPWLLRHRYRLTQAK